LRRSAGNEHAAGQRPDFTGDAGGDRSGCASGEKGLRD
jgi:hypothetical protein